MSKKILKKQFEELESIWKKDEEGVEYILARDLAKVLGYKDKYYWKNFKKVIEKAKKSCENNGYSGPDHFADVTNMVYVGSGAKRKIEDVKLTRYACYLTAQNGDPRKQEVAFAQNYFATQTRKFELVMQRQEDFERILERNELKGVEKIFAENLYQRGVDGKGFARVRSKGDEALFGGNTTKQMKERLGVKNKERALADFLDPIAVTAKKLATQISNKNVKDKDLYGEEPINKQHIKSNTTIREALIKEDIYPEKLPPAEDIKKVERRLNKEVKQISKPKKKLKKAKSKGIDI